MLHYLPAMKSEVNRVSQPKCLQNLGATEMLTSHYKEMATRLLCLHLYIYSYNFICTMRLNPAILNIFSYA